MKTQALLLMILGGLLAGCSSQPNEYLSFADARIVEHQRAGTVRPRLQVSLDATLPEEVLEALHHGVPLTFVIAAQARQPRDWLPDRQLAEVITTLRLTWHPMSKQYVVITSPGGEQHSVARRDLAAGALSGPFTIDLPVTALGQTGFWRLRAELDLDELPSPLRLPAWFSSDWHLSSGWYRVKTIQ